MRRIVVVLASLGALALLSSCGSGPGLSARASAQLEGRVQAVRSAAVSHDRTQAAMQLAQLRLQVNQLEQQGQISSSKAKALLDAVAAVQAQLDSIPIRSVPTTTVPSPPSTAKPTQSNQDQHGHGGDHANGGGDGGDGGDGGRG